MKKHCTSQIVIRFYVLGCGSHFFLDHLSGKTDTELDSATFGRIREISVMPEDDKKQVFLVLDALIRNTRQMYAQ